MTRIEQKTIRQQIRAYWEQKLDTWDMARALQLDEATIERELHVVLELRRAVVGSLGQ